MEERNDETGENVELERDGVNFEYENSRDALIDAILEETLQDAVMRSWNQGIINRITHSTVADIWHTIQEVVEWQRNIASQGKDAMVPTETTWEDEPVPTLLDRHSIRSIPTKVKKQKDGRRELEHRQPNDHQSVSVSPSIPHLLQSTKRLIKVLHSSFAFQSTSSNQEKLEEKDSTIQQQREPEPAHTTNEAINHSETKDAEEEREKWRVRCMNEIRLKTQAKLRWTKLGRAGQVIGRRQVSEKYEQTEVIQPQQAPPLPQGQATKHRLPDTFRLVRDLQSLSPTRLHPSQVKGKLKNKISSLPSSTQRRRPNTSLPKSTSAASSTDSMHHPENNDLWQIASLANLKKSGVQSTVLGKGRDQETNQQQLLEQKRRDEKKETLANAIPSYYDDFQLEKMKVPYIPHSKKKDLMAEKIQLADGVRLRIPPQQAHASHGQPRAITAMPSRKTLELQKSKERDQTLRGMDLTLLNPEKEPMSFTTKKLPDRSVSAGFKPVEMKSTDMASVFSMKKVSLLSSDDPGEASSIFPSKTRIVRQGLSSAGATRSLRVRNAPNLEPLTPFQQRASKNKSFSVKIRPNTAAALSTEVPQGALVRGIHSSQRPDIVHAKSLVVNKREE